MAYDTNRLSKLANLRETSLSAGTPGLFLYQSDTTIAATSTAGYFNSGRSELGQALPGAAVKAFVIAVCTDGVKFLTLTLPANNTGNITAAATAFA